MGENKQDSKYDNETPKHTVKINSFKMAATPVTNIEFAKFIKATGYKTTAELNNWSIAAYWDINGVNQTLSHYAKVACNWQFDEFGKPIERSKDNYPVIYISWVDTINYCNFLNKEKGYKPVYDKIGNLLDTEGNITKDITKVKGYRLPTEAEWEYAARGGASAGSATTYSGSNNFKEVAKCFDAEVYNLLPVGKTEQFKKPNDLNLWDMSGNVWEWCYDNYTNDYYQTCKDNNIVNNPVNAEKSSDRVYRGGSWGSSARDCRVANRNYNDPGNSNINIGFRLVFVP